MASTITAVRGAFFDFVDDPWKHPGNEETAARFIADAMLVIENGRIKAYGAFETLSAEFPDVDVTHITNRLIVPGFVDGHIHVPQTRVLGAYGQELLGWLQQWVFPEERKYGDPAYAQDGVRHFFDNLLAAGTTTCQAFTTSSPVSTEAFFEEAASRDMLVISGLIGIDRFAPDDSTNTAESFYRDSKRLIEKYHRKGRNLYAITPRFALGCSNEMMTACQHLKEEFPDVWVQTHISESPAEVREVREVHQVSDYLQAYEQYHLVGPKFTGAHGIWLSDDEFRRFSTSGATIAFCPVSNLFLGSGLFKLGRAMNPSQRVKLCLGTDIGGGNRFSLINTLDEAYKVGMCNHGKLESAEEAPRHEEAERNKLSPYRAFWLATLGGAEALHLNDRIGNFQPGKEADFVVLDWNAGQSAMPWHQSLVLGEGGRPNTVADAANVLFAIMTVGDDRNVESTWIKGKQLYKRAAAEPALATSH